jgi:hypothetical protein
VLERCVESKKQQVGRARLAGWTSRLRLASPPHPVPSSHLACVLLRCGMSRLEAEASLAAMWAMWLVWVPFLC